MSTIHKRALLQALFGVAVVSVSSAAIAQTPALLTGIDRTGAAVIGRAWLAIHPESRRALEQRLFPDRVTEAAIRRLAEQARADFRARRLFVHAGWRLSETEARLCALLSLQPG